LTKIDLTLGLFLPATILARAEIRRFFGGAVERWKVIRFCLEGFLANRYKHRVPEQQGECLMGLDARMKAVGRYVTHIVLAIRQLDGVLVPEERLVDNGEVVPGVVDSAGDELFNLVVVVHLELFEELT